MSSPPSYGVGIWKVISLWGQVAKILVGDSALAGEVLPRSAEGAFPLLGLALHYPVPHLPTQVTHLVMTFNPGVSETPRFVAAARLILVLDGQPDWSHSDHTQNWSMEQHLPTTDAILHFRVGHIVPPALTNYLSIDLEVINDHLIR